MEGVGDVEEACYLGLKPGSRILLWYADDSVWHEALVGLVLGGEEIVMYTPDKDLYVEAVGCKGDYRTYQAERPASQWQPSQQPESSCLRFL